MTGLRLRDLQPVQGLAPVDLDIPAGALLLLSGPSGSGKTLLLRAIADLDPHPGQAWLGTAARAEMPPCAWRRQVGLLLAESGWWQDRVGAHFPPNDRVGDMLSALGFDPDVLDWTVARLSSGERQRLALARLLANRPSALLLDEPTANLDPANRERVEDLVLGYLAAHQAAVLWVSHDPDQRTRLGARVATRRLLIDGPRLVDEAWN